MEDPKQFDGSKCTLLNDMEDPLCQKETEPLALNLILDFPNSQTLSTSTTRELDSAIFDRNKARKITRSKKIAEEMKRMAFFDYLTRLPNRRYLENQLRKEILRAKGNKTSFALMLIDLDEFKYVNNSFGHSIGDQLLEDFSARLRDSYSHDEILCRLDGDEFIILMPGIFSLEEIHKHAGKLVSIINEKPFTVRGNDFFITISVGVSVYPYSGESMDLLLKNADMAMYRAKSNGKNQYQIFSPTMNLFTYKQFTLRNDSKRALANNEYSIFYQPVLTQ